MSAMGRLKVLVAWLCFFAGVTLIVSEIIRLQITGLAVVGVILLVAWLALIGGFRREFWVSGDQGLSRVDEHLDKEAEARIERIRLSYSRAQQEVVERIVAEINERRRREQEGDR